MLAVSEFQGRVLLTQVMDYYFTSDGQVMVRMEKGNKDAKDMDKDKAAEAQAQLMARFNGPGRGPRGLPNPAGDTKQQVGLQKTSIDKVAELGGKLAKKVQPYRMVIVEGAFPYRAQLEAFRSALLYPTIEDMLKDKDKVFIDAEGKEPTIAFLGLKIERRTVAATGKKSEWEVVDLETPYRDMRFLSVGAVPENPELLNYGLIVRQLPSRLLMPRPELARPSQKYPDLAAGLKTISDSLAAQQATFKEKAPPVIQAPNRFQKDQFDAFQTPGTRAKSPSPCRRRVPLPVRRPRSTRGRLRWPSCPITAWCASSTSR